MKLCGEIVYHKSFGKGQVVEHNEEHVFVLFENIKEAKRFQYPEAFGLYIKLDNKKLMLEIEKEKKEKELKRVEKQKKIKKETIKTEKDNEKQKKSKITKTKDLCNVAFKCTYCDGGKDKKNIGFKGICSDDTIRYNISKEKHVWCSNESSYCSNYLNGEISRRELDHIIKNNDFVCYESKMLRDWEAFAGFHHNGKNKGKPMTMRNVSSNNLALLTTRFPYEKEVDRIIFAVFLILDNYEGDNYEEGHVKANQNYKLQLTIEEARKLKFWDYYYNQNKPEAIKYGSGLHRYISDKQAAQVLKKICQIKKGTNEEKFTEEFLEYYCGLKQLDINDIPEPNGALKR